MPDFCLYSVACQSVGRITKCKVRLDIHDGQTKEGALGHICSSGPNVTMLYWPHPFYSLNIDSILILPHTMIKVDIYMKIPFGLSVPQDGQYVLKLHKNSYGLKNAL